MADEVLVSAPDLQDLTRLYPDTSDSILVAGQALATWVDVFQLPLPRALDAGVTQDLDFLGNRDAAERHHNILSGRFGRVELMVPKFGDITPNTAKILVYGPDQTAVTAEIDYLGALCGYQLEDEDRLRRRAIKIEFPGFDMSAEIRVMHPFDCLKSRVHNLTTLTSKQNPRGLAQTHLAVDVLRAYFQKVLRTDAADLRMLVFPMVEAVFELACSADGVRAYHEFGVDVTGCIDIELFPQLFRERRWPKAQETIQRRRYGRRGRKMLPGRRDLTWGR